MRSRNVWLGVGLALGLGILALSVLYRTTVDAPDARVGVAGGSYTQISALRLKRMFTAKDFFLVNVQMPYAGEIAQTDLLIANEQIAQNWERLPQSKDTQIVVYCLIGEKSATAAALLVRQGYTKVWMLDRGMVAWLLAGEPLVQK